MFPVWEHPYRFDVICRPDWIPKGTRVVNALQIGRALLGENIDKSIPLKSMMCWNANPVTQAPETEKIVEALQREDFFLFQLNILFQIRPPLLIYYFLRLWVLNKKI